MPIRWYITLRVLSGVMLSSESKRSGKLKCWKNVSNIESMASDGDFGREGNKLFWKCGRQNTSH